MHGTGPNLPLARGGGYAPHQDPVSVIPSGLPSAQDELREAMFNKTVRYY